MAFWAALPAIASIASSFFKPKSGSTSQNLPDWQQQLGGQLGEWAGSNLANYTPGEAYGGQFSAPMSSFEQTGLGILGNYLNSPATGQTFQAGNQQLMDTLGGKYLDPNTNPLIQSLTKLSGQNLSDSITQARGQAGARGNYFSTSAMNQESQLRERSQNYLDTVIGGLLNTERGRQFSAIPYAQSYDQYANQTAPLAQVGASQTFGSLERTLEQSNLDKMYQDYVRQRGEQSQVPGIATSLYRSDPQMTQSSGEPSSMNNILKMISQLNLGSIGQPGSNIWDIFKPQSSIA